VFSSRISIDSSVQHCSSTGVPYEFLDAGALRGPGVDAHPGATRDLTVFASSLK